MTRITQPLLLACLASLGSACGGGDSQEDVNRPSILFPKVSLPAQVISPWTKTEVKPIITGLEGQQASCTSSDSPIGVTVLNDCTVVVDGASPGGHTFDIDLAVSGYSGSNGFEVTLVIDGPRLSYTFLTSTSRQERLAWLIPISGDRGNPVLTNYSAVPGDSIAYRSSSTLPSGLTLDPTTGVVAGTPRVPGNFNTGIYAELTRGGKAIKLRIPSPYLPVSAPSANYQEVIASTSEVTKQAIPFFYDILPTDSYSFEFHTTPILTNLCPSTQSWAKPNEILLNTTTGAFRPTNNAVGTYCVPLAIRTIRNGETHLHPTIATFRIR